VSQCCQFTLVACLVTLSEMLSRQAQTAVDSGSLSCTSQSRTFAAPACVLSGDEKCVAVTLCEAAPVSASLSRTKAKQAALLGCRYTCNAVAVRRIGTPPAPRAPGMQLGCPHATTGRARGCHASLCLRPDRGCARLQQHIQLKARRQPQRVFARPAAVQQPLEWQQAAPPRPAPQQTTIAVQQRRPPARRQQQSFSILRSLIINKQVIRLAH